MTEKSRDGGELISARRRRTPSGGTRDADRTRRNLLDAAYREFSESGYHGASVERICRRAGVSKQILSHHFGSKEKAHLAVLEAAYLAQRAQDARLDDDTLDPVLALGNFAGLAFDHLQANRAFVSLLADENVNKGRGIRASVLLRDVYAPLIRRLAGILRRGEAEGRFRRGIDPLQLYISISGLTYFYFSNTYTLSAVFGRDMMDPAALAERRTHVVEFVLAATCLTNQTAG